MIKNKKDFVVWGVTFISLALLQLVLCFARDFDYYPVMMTSLMFMFGLNGIVNSMFDESDKEREEQRKVDSAIEFKANNIAITVTKICVVLFFGGIYLLRGTTWITEALMGYGMVAMVVFDVMIFSELFAKIYYIKKMNR